MSQTPQSIVRIGMVSYIPITIVALGALLFFSWTFYLDGPLRDLGSTLRQRERNWVEIEAVARHVRQNGSEGMPEHVQRILLDRLKDLLANDDNLLETIDSRFSWLERQWLSSIYDKQLANARANDVAPNIRNYVRNLSRSPTYLIDARHTGLSSTDAVLLHSGKALEPIELQYNLISQIEQMLMLLRAPLSVALAFGLLVVSWGSWFWLLRPQLARFRSMQLEIAHRERRANTTLASIKDAVIVTNHEGQVESINRAASELSGYAIEDVRGKKIEEVFHFEREDDGETGSLGGASNGRALVSRTRSTGLRTKGGEIRLINKSAAPIAYPNGDIDGIVFIFRDVTEERKRERHLRHVEKLQAVGYLAAGMAHEFNNALAIISGTSEMYGRHLGRTDRMDAKSSQYLQTVSSTVKRSRALTERLLSLARTPGTEIQLVDVFSLLAETVSILRQTSSRAVKITLVNETPDKGRVMLMANASALQSAFLNLGLNSLKAVDDQGQITIAVGIAGNPRPGVTASQRPQIERVKISWSDNGHGIAENDLKRIFDPFFSLRSGRGGNGLGLTIVQQVILTHNGTFDVTSRPGEGTCFTIYFPRSDDMPEAPAEAVMVIEQRPSKGSRILIVDDESSFLVVVQEFLEASGYTTLVARDGIEAIDLFREHHKTIAVTVLDINLPMQSGTVVARTMRDLDPFCRIVISTGYVDQFPHRDITDTTFTGVMRKPYELATLAAEIERLLEIPHP